jgi:hypothetical protein
MDRVLNQRRDGRTRAAIAQQGRHEREIRGAIEPMATPHPRIATRQSASVFRKMLRNHIAVARCCRSVVVAVIAKEDVFEAGLVADEVHDRVLAGELDQVVDAALEYERRVTPSGARIHAFEAVSGHESASCGVWLRRSVSMWC